MNTSPSEKCKKVVQINRKLQLTHGMTVTTCCIIASYCGFSCNDYWHFFMWGPSEQLDVLCKDYPHLHIITGSQHRKEEIISWADFMIPAVVDFWISAKSLKAALECGKTSIPYIEGTIVENLVWTI